jgi:hypothetical protein
MDEKMEEAQPRYWGNFNRIIVNYADIKGNHIKSVVSDLNTEGEYRYVRKNLDVWYVLNKVKLIGTEVHFFYKEV